MQGVRPFQKRKGLKKTSKKKTTLEERVTNEKKRIREIRDRLEKAKTHGEKDHRDMVEAKGLAQLTSSSWCVQ